LLRRNSLCIPKIQPAGVCLQAVYFRAADVIIKYEPKLRFAVVIRSSPNIQNGKTYTITVGSKSFEFAAG